MVLAEIPLWVIHQNTTTAAASSALIGSGDPAHPHGRGVLGNEHPHDDAKIQQAQRSLSLLLPSGTTHKNAKCAIYSVDVHPDGTIFATAGGDGTVRIWNVDSLFAGPHKSGSKFDATTGAYVSSSSGSSSSDDNGGGNSSNSNSEHEHGKKTRGGDGNESAASSSNSSSSVAQPEQVHDLNAVVRRKKGGAAVASLPTKPPPTTKTNAATTTSTTTASSPHQSKHKSIHHPRHHRLLCTLSAHTGSSVLCVRFSTTGQYLASAGDDACVCIYAPKKGMPASSGNLTSEYHPNQQHQQQHWARILLCRGHNLDVVDLAWAPDDSHLVSCSLDSNAPICVWKIHNNNNSTSNNNSMILHPFQILGASAHTSTVKGVTFDPAGSYLASSGDDPAVCIWRAHDDWGLEARIDAQTGIFRSWKDNDVMTSQSLFRRISWSTDGAFVCSTNSVVKNKHVASTISREGWTVSGGNNNNNNSGAANLVGHKQPVVVSRHAPRLLDARKRKKQSKKNNNSNPDPKQQASPSNSSSSSDDEISNRDDDDDEPEHATLLALGDRRGFVTVWSTRKSRPLFKLQCSGESRCTVTDLSWGVLPRDGHLILLVSLLDGQLVALRFQVPDEMGPLLSREDHARVFQLRYGIDLRMGTAADDATGGRRLVGNAGPKLIENALQMTLEDDLMQQQSQREDHDMDAVGGGDDDPFGTVDPVQPQAAAAAAAPALQQQVVEMTSKGKKRIRPVLLSLNDGDNDTSRPKVVKPNAPSTAPADPFQHALDVAERASAVVAAESRKQQQKETASPASTKKATESTDPTTTGESTARSFPPTAAVAFLSRLSMGTAGIVLPHNTDRVHSTDLPVQGRLDDSPSLPTFVAECINEMKVPTASKGVSLPCLDLSISLAGRVTWKDQIPGTFCSVIAASRQLLAVGMADGSIQLWGTSPTLGWASGSAFRSHPALVVGSPVVSLQLKERRQISSSGSNKDDTALVEMLVVTGDGAFAVYTLTPAMCLVYKGSVLPAMTHMSLGCLSFSQEERPFPKLSRIQITDRGRLFLLLSLDSALQSSTHRHLGGGDRTVGTRTTALAVDGGAGGSLQAFVYDRASELWLRIADSRFVLSDFYSALPTSSTNLIGSGGILSKMDDAVRLGSLQSSLKPSHRGRLWDRQAETIYNQVADDSGNFIASRSHCEDRMACAVALESAADFKQWLLFYVRALALRGHAQLIRSLVDLLLGVQMESSSEFVAERIGCWWLSTAPSVLNLERVALVRNLIIPELSKNRSLQRLTNEIAVEIENQG